MIGFGWALAALVAPASAQPAAPPTLHSSAVLLIRLAVAESRCTGSNKKIVARYRQMVLRDYADGLRGVGQEMTAQYRATHDENWRLALDTDMAAMRTSFEHDADQKGFCKQAAMRARHGAGGFDTGSGHFRDAATMENDIVRLSDRIR
ncbi:hypothetical protein [Sandarakinorhabdus sp.]|uniref:hypothetical protein n=1 Tax=Sandarakinorhabdus sp. TaxID=1916663 RepID=UPI003F72F665